MGFHQLRRLSEECEDCYKDCGSQCFKICYNICYPDDPIPPSTPVSNSGSHTNPTTTKLLIVTFTILAAAFLVVCYYIYYVRFSRGRANARRRSSQPETTETRDEFLDEDHGPIIDHPIWYINTVGLQPSVINSITVCKYKKGEGLVEGTDCAVCLSEFEEDETVRLLPKCSHAFHIPCIDTWLRSHTNCPMCRAPIVSNTANIQPSSSSDQVNTEDSDSGVTEEAQVVIIEDDDEEQQQQQGDLEIGDIGASESRVKAEELGGGESSEIQAMRRSVSLDSLAASQISQAVVDGVGEENELRGKGKESSSSVRIVPRRGGGNQGLLRLMCHSSLGISLSSRPIFMKRSFSCNGKFSLPICNNNNKQSRNKNPPLRSF